MKATEFVKKEGLWVFKYALAQLSFNKDMFLVVYHYECEFVSEVKDNHGDCVFSYREVKQIVDAFDCVMEHGSVDRAKKYAESDYTAPEVRAFLNNAINLVEQCL